MRTENSHLIAPSYPFGEIFTRINGVSADRAGRPMLIAWMLEDVAAQNGWQVGALLGTERDLITQFAVSRDTVREAVRIVEARGSMQMQRGRMGGLRLLSPHVEDVASALAAYLLACDCSKADVSEIAAVATPIFAELGNDALVSSLFHHTIATLTGGETHGAAGGNRANTIASRLLERHGAPPQEGIFLGDEALLSERLGCTRPALREALRVLADLSILKVRRGRGGGFTLVRPSQDAIVRRAFGLIASQHLSMNELVPALWALDLIRLRLAMRHLRLLDDQARERQCDELAALLTSGTEPVRWYHLQRTLDRIANNGVLSVVAESFTYYLARLNQTDAIWREAIRRWSEIDASMHETEEALVGALRADDTRAAEQVHLKQHNLISRVIDGPSLPGSLNGP